jgi:menaquinone-dependent protoporphyrinogen oxidase
MPGVLVVYASRHGHTHTVADRIGARLARRGRTVRIVDLEHEPAPEAADADAIVVGASLHAGQHQHAVKDWVRAHRALLDERPSAFFSVSLTAAEDTAQAHEQLGLALERFVQQTGWTPPLTADIAGAIQYRRYGWFMKRLMRGIAKRHGASTNTDEDVVLTDWAAVDDFAERLATELERPRTAEPGPVSRG